MSFPGISQCPGIHWMEVCSDFGCFQDISDNRLFLVLTVWVVAVAFIGDGL